MSLGKRKPVQQPLFVSTADLDIRPHPFFKQDGAHIRIELPVTLTEAVLGGKITVPTVDGPVTMTVPKGSNTGTTLRLKGKGMPNAGGRGDQYVRLEVVLPDKPDPGLEQFIEKWNGHDYDVRGKLGLSK